VTDRGDGGRRGGLTRSVVVISATNAAVPLPVVALEEVDTARATGGVYASAAAMLTE
jgi:hypothetical protein